MTVPDVVGLSWDDAWAVLEKKGLVATSSDPDGLPVGIVTDQSPESGAMAVPGAPVRLWLSRGDGGAGVREPRRPKPDPKSGRKMRDEITGETVS